MKKSIRLVLYAVLMAALLIVSACGSQAEPASTSVPDEPTTESTGAADAEAETASEVETEAVDEAPASGARTFVIQTEESSASYIVDEEFLPEMLSKYGIGAGRVDTVGTTPGVEGRLTLNLDDLAAPLGDNEFRVDLSQLSSDQSLRDEWLQQRGPQFAQYPSAEFVATGVENAPAQYTEGEEVNFQLVGELTVRDVTQPATFDVVAALDGDRLSGVATADLRMTDFGIEPPDFANTLRVQDDFQVRIEFVAVAE